MGSGPAAASVSGALDKQNAPSAGPQRSNGRAPAAEKKKKAHIRGHALPCARGATPPIVG